MAAPAQPAPEQAQEQQHKPAAPSLLEQITDEQIKRDMEALNYASSYGKMAASSGYWQNDTVNPAQGAAKILIGRELGIGPMVSLQNISIQNGKISFTSELLAALMKRDGYEWKFIEHTPTVCHIACYKGGEPIIDEHGKTATIKWTIEDAKRADLVDPRGQGEKKAKSVYEKYPEDLLFWRCITRFQRRHAPEVTKGFTAYTADEMEEISQAELDALKIAAGAGMGDKTAGKAAALKAKLEAEKEAAA